MRLLRTAGLTSWFILNLTAVTSLMAQEKVGEVLDVKVEAFVIRDEVEESINKPDDIFIGDLLGVHRRNSKLSVILSDSDNEPIEIRYGYMRLAGDAELIECQFKKGNFVIKGPPQPCIGSTPDIGKIEEQGTLYEIDVSASDSRVFVFEGAVAVYSTNPAYPDPRMVHAGEWVRARKGQPIPQPQKFMWAPGPGSGSSECIYSDCSLINKVPIPPPPVFTPRILLPPPPNPPGQR